MIQKGENHGRNARNISNCLTLVLFQVQELFNVFLRVSFLGCFKHHLFRDLDANASAMAANLTVMKANLTSMEANMTATAFLLKETKSNLTVIERWLKLAVGPEEDLDDLSGFLRKGVRDKGSAVNAYDTVEDQNYVNEILNSLYSTDTVTVKTERVEVDHKGPPVPEVSQNKNIDSGKKYGEVVEHNKQDDFDLKAGEGNNPKDNSLDSIVDEVHDSVGEMKEKDQKGLVSEGKVKGENLMDQNREAKGNKKNHGDTGQIRLDDNWTEDLVNPKLLHVDNKEGGNNVSEDKNNSDNVGTKGEVKNSELKPAKGKEAENDNQSNDSLNKDSDSDQVASGSIKYKEINLNAGDGDKIPINSKKEKETEVDDYTLDEKEKRKKSNIETLKNRGVENLEPTKTIDAGSQDNIVFSEPIQDQKNIERSKNDNQDTASTSDDDPQEHNDQDENQENVLNPPEQ
jgi:hypothetical protein